MRCDRDPRNNKGVEEGSVNSPHPLSTWPCVAMCVLCYISFTTIQEYYAFKHSMTISVIKEFLYSLLELRLCIYYYFRWLCNVCYLRIYWVG